MVVALDAALKAARVELATSHLVGGGLAAATIRGDVGSVQAALAAALAVITGLGGWGTTHIIPRPDQSVPALLGAGGASAPGAPPSAPGGGRPSALPAAKPRAGLPVARPAASVPAVKAETRVPAAKPGTEVPAVKPEPPAPAARPETRAPLIKKNYDRHPSFKPRGETASNGEAPAKPGSAAKKKKPGPPPKPRKPGKK